MSQPLTIRTDSGDEHLDLADFEARVRQGEVSPQSLVRLPAVTGDAFVPACELEVFKALHEPKRAYFARAFSLTRFPWVTAALILLNLAVYLYTVRGGPLDLDSMVLFGGKAGPLVTDLGELWRLFTANFLHRDALHIGLNMFVLFNAGGALENTYRTLDYLWLLVFSGLATMTASLFLSDAVSLGASGMVFGCLGAIVVFGLKYRSLLPSRYRTVMGDAAIPTVLGLLLIGITSDGVDNWAHVGGLLAGMLTAAFMRPRLLADLGPWWSPAVRAAPTLLIAAVVAFGQPLFASSLPSMRVERDDAYGVAVPVPKSWRWGADRMGSMAYNNGLPDSARATFAAAVVEMPDGADPAQVAKRFVLEVLEPRALGLDVNQVRTDEQRPAKVGDRDALKLTAAFETTTGVTKVAAYFVPRGDLVYQLVFKYPAAFPRYGGVVDQMVQGVRFDEPQALRKARARALLFPNAPVALGELGAELRRSGEPFAAAEALKTAVKGDPSRVAFRTELALALLSTGEVEAACEASHDATVYGPDDVAALEADARCEVARGNPARALERLAAARRVDPRDEHLKDAEERLKRTLAQ